ncbi:hypothetical protein D3C81_632800 [compost metagenome]|nr:hypothetical protein [Paenibacillus stellifer]
MMIELPAPYNRSRDERAVELAIVEIDGRSRGQYTAFHCDPSNDKLGSLAVIEQNMLA